MSANLFVHTWKTRMSLSLKKINQIKIHGYLKYQKPTILISLSVLCFAAFNTVSHTNLMFVVTNRYFFSCCWYVFEFFQWISLYFCTKTLHLYAAHMIISFAPHTQTIEYPKRQTLVCHCRVSAAFDSCTAYISSSL